MVAVPTSGTATSSRCQEPKTASAGHEPKCGVTRGIPGWTACPLPNGAFVVHAFMSSPLSRCTRASLDRSDGRNSRSPLSHDARLHKLDEALAPADLLGHLGSQRRRKGFAHVPSARSCPLRSASRSPFSTRAAVPAIKRTTFLEKSPTWRLFSRPFPITPCRVSGCDSSWTRFAPDPLLSAIRRRKLGPAQILADH